jgi:hypothetical protein
MLPPLAPAGVFCCRFVASANLHEGAHVANYPLDGYPDHSQKLTGERNPAPDDKAFQYFAKLYAKKHAFMAKSKVSTSHCSRGQSQHSILQALLAWL